MCWDRIVEAETPEQKRVQAPQPSKPKAEQGQAVSQPPSPPLTAALPELVETR